MKFNEKMFSAEQAKGSVNIAIKWARALESGEKLSDVLADFQHLCDAVTVQLVRQMSNIDCARIIARQEKSAGKMFERPPHSYAKDLLGVILHSANVGCLFTMSDMDISDDTRDHLDKCGLLDVCVISLANQTGHSDFLEFHFQRRILKHNRDLLAMLGSVLAQSWQKRATGVIATLLAKHPQPITINRRGGFENILGSHNPTNLTRCEFRICTLVQDGRLPDEISEILHISKSTFRTHLRAIYLKTNVSGHVELVHLLHRSGRIDRPHQIAVGQ